ncbi:MAG: hypothetical protein JO213_01795 [Alphaproteobacteria bacterium]|nr:hypothetical protein [Alphaproteobacteria bacterium]
MLQRNLPYASPGAITEAHALTVEGSAARVLIAGAALLALFSIPIFSTVLPPLFDYPNHLARFWLLATGGNEFYAVRWAPLPNLAGDLIVPVLARAMPLDLAGKLFLVMIFALILGGAVWLNRMATGAWRLWPLFAIAFLYNREFLWGFINYLFGFGVALCGAALWLRLERARPSLRVTASSLVALLCFFSHIAAFGLYGLIILGIETQPAVAEYRARDWPSLMRRAALFAAQFAIPAAIVLGSWSAVATGGIGYAGFWRKPDLLFSTFDNYSRPFDIACFALLLLLFAALAWRGRLHIAPRLMPALALVFAAFLLLPSQFLSGSGLDHRIPVALFVLLVAAAAPRFPSRRIATIAAAATAIVLFARLAVVESVWLHSDRIYAADLAALDALPAGTKLAVAYPADAVNSTAIPQTHLPVLAVARRAAFVPTLFAYPAQQPIALKPPYDRLAAAASPFDSWAAFMTGDTPANYDVLKVLAQYDAIVFLARKPFAVPEQPCLVPAVVMPTFQLFTLSHGGACP